MDSDEPLSGVGQTALGAAMMRAQESLRPDRLFDDPYAALFVAAAPSVFADEPADSDAAELAALEAAFRSHIAIRTRFYDDYLLAACTAGCGQVVLLAAGLDTRAFRLDWPDHVRLFELDLPRVLDFKEAVLTQHGAVPRCARVALPADLREDWPDRLVDGGFDPSVRTAWVMEGLLAYLSSDEAARLLTAVGELSSAGSRVALESAGIRDDSLLARAGALPTMNRVTRLWKGSLDDDRADWLGRRCWDIQTHDYATLAAMYERQIPEHSTTGFLTGVRGSKPEA